jgi:hypothetical protein
LFATGTQPLTGSKQSGELSKSGGNPSNSNKSGTKPLCRANSGIQASSKQTGFVGRPRPLFDIDVGFGTPKRAGPQQPVFGAGGGFPFKEKKIEIRGKSN